ncbi:MAG TPA: transporter substrate-binding domain-containing protein [Paenisporosarcina sp.]|nr:transporter substrate-binding domain-containing protein [Paenisporosarcina sp.]
MKKWSVLFMGFCLSLLVVAGCSQGDAKSDNALENIEESKVIRVGIEGAYPPFNYYNDKNELEGFDVDIANEIASRMGVEVEYVVTPWDSIIGGLLSDKYDVIISSMAITEERKEKVDFTEPYYRTGAQLFALEDSEMVDANTDVKGKNIGVSTGTTFTEKVEELGGTAKLYKNDFLAFQDLANGRIDGVITDKAVGSRLILENDYPAKAIGDILYDEVAGITLNKNQEDLLKEISKHIEELDADGTYKEISMKWFGENIR